MHHSEQRMRSFARSVAAEAHWAGWGVQQYLCGSDILVRQLRVWRGRPACDWSLSTTWFVSGHVFRRADQDNTESGFSPCGFSINLPDSLKRSLVVRDEMRHV